MVYSPALLTIGCCNVERTKWKRFSCLRHMEVGKGLQGFFCPSKYIFLLSLLPLPYIWNLLISYVSWFLRKKPQSLKVSWWWHGRKEIKSLWSAGSPFTLVQMHPEHLLHVLRTICSGWWKLCWFLYTEHLEDVFQGICHGQALGSLLQQESLCSLGWTAFQIS